MSFNFMAAVTTCSDFGAQKIKSATVSTISPSICHKVMGLDLRCHDLSFLNVELEANFFTLLFHFHLEAV